MSRTEAKAATRRRILDAAAVVFSARGFAGASVRDIAAAAGYTTGALFSHFATKDDLFLALLDERYRAKVEALRAAVRAGGIDALGHRFTQVTETEGDAALLATEFWLYAVRHPDVRQRLAGLQDEFRAGVADLIRAHVPDLTPRQASRAAAAVIAVGDGLGMQVQLEPRYDGRLFGWCVAALVTGLR